MGPLFPRSAAQRQFLIRFDAVVASVLLGGTSHSGHECGEGGGDRTSAPMLGAGCRHAGSGVPTSGRAAGAAPRAGQVTGVAAAAARAVAEGHGDVCPSGSVPTADRAGGAAAAATATAAAGCQATSCSALSGGAAALVAAAGGRSVCTPTSSTQWPPAHSAAASDARHRGGAVRWGSQGVPRHDTSPPTNKVRHGVSAATSLATGRRAARGAAPQREDDWPAVTELGGVVSPPQPPQMPPAGGCVVIAPRAGAASVPARERGTAASVLWSGGGRRQGNGGRASHQAKGICGAGGVGGSSSGHRGNDVAAAVTQSSYVRKGTACGYMSAQNSMMEWDTAHSDCVGVIKSVTLPRRYEKVKRRTTLVFGIQLTQELLPFATRHAQASCACHQEVREKKKHHVTVDRGAQVG